MPLNSPTPYPGSELNDELLPIGRCRNNYDGVAAGFTGVAFGAVIARRAGVPSVSGAARVALDARRALRAGIALGSGRARHGNRRCRDIDHSRFVAGAQTKNRYECYKQC